MIAEGGISAFLVKNLWAMLTALAIIAATVGRVLWVTANNTKRIDKLEEKLDEDRKEFSNSIHDLRAEMLSNFKDLNTNLKEIMWKLVDKDGKPS